MFRIDYYIEIKLSVSFHYLYPVMVFLKGGYLLRLHNLEFSLGIHINVSSYDENRMHIVNVKIPW